MIFCQKGNRYNINFTNKYIFTIRLEQHEGCGCLMYARKKRPTFYSGIHCYLECCLAAEFNTTCINLNLTLRVNISISSSILWLSILLQMIITRGFVLFWSIMLERNYEYSSHQFELKILHICEASELDQMFSGLIIIVFAYKYDIMNRFFNSVLSQNGIFAK